MLHYLIEWTVRFVREIVAPWIVRKGGWVSVHVLGHARCLRRSTLARDPT